MSGVPDYPLGETLDFKFTTRAFATGIPTTLAGTPVIQVYEDNSVTQITAGITLTADFDSVAGLNNVRIVATSGNGYESGKSYTAVISTGTVGGVSVVGEVVQQFSIERSPALRPTTAGRTVDINASGHVERVVLVDTTTTNTDMRGTDSALLAASAPTNFGDLAITVTTGQVTVGTNNDKSSYNLAADQSGVTVGTVTTLTGHTAQTGDSFARLGAPAGASVSADNAAIKAETALIKTEADKIPGLVPTQNEALSNIEFLMVDSTDHVTPKTGLTVTGQRSIDGGAFGAVSGTIAEVSNGIYQFDALAADMNGGIITFRFSGTGADDTFLTIRTAP